MRMSSCLTWIIIKVLTVLEQLSIIIHKILTTEKPSLILPWIPTIIPVKAIHFLVSEKMRDTAPPHEWNALCNLDLQYLAQFRNDIRTISFSMHVSFFTDELEIIVPNN